MKNRGIQLKTGLAIALAAMMLSACGKDKKAPVKKTPENLQQQVTTLEADKVKEDFAAPSLLAGKMAEGGVFLILDPDKGLPLENPVLVQTVKDKTDAAQEAVGAMAAAIAKIKNDYSKKVYIKEGEKTLHLQLTSAQVTTLDKYSEVLKLAIEKLGQIADGAEPDQGKAPTAEAIQDAVAIAIQYDGMKKEEPKEEGKENGLVGLASRGPGGGDPPVVGGGD